MKNDFYKIKSIFIQRVDNSFLLKYRIAMNEYAEFQDNQDVVNQLNEVLTYLAGIPSMKFKINIYGL